MVFGNLEGFVEGGGLVVVKANFEFFKGKLAETLFEDEVELDFDSVAEVDNTDSILVG